MCGIIGYVGKQNATEILINALARLEYRGYDSAGIAVISDDHHISRKKAGKLQVLRDAIKDDPPQGHIGIGHTRWATHGKPNDVNAHPHSSEDGKLALIHNGIIENYQELKQGLLERGHTFLSETDSEVVVHLLEEHYRDNDFVTAVRKTLSQLEGAYALVISHQDEDVIIAARNTSPLLIGVGEGENFLASDATALLEHTRKVIYLNDGDMAVLSSDAVSISDFAGQAISHPIHEIEWDLAAAEKGGYEHYMLKEIYEQPNVVQQTLTGRLLGNSINLEDEISLDASSIKRVVITAAGTAFYAGMVGEYLLEQLSRLPVEVEIASEYRYRQPIVEEGTLCIVVSQSGETIDTLEALREAKRGGARTLGIINVKGSTIAREVDDVLYLRGGPEIGVASTKAYMGMLTIFEMLAIWLGRQRGVLEEAKASELVQGLRELPQLLEEALQERESIAEIAETFKNYRDYLFLGRGVNFPSALEGALKLKEISYIHAEAYATGEMKHGPIALIDANMPVVVIATDSALYDKTVSNLQEVRARDGIVIALGNTGDARIQAQSDHFIAVPKTHELLSPLVNVIALQFLAYETAARLGKDVDQPRNLAKSVTVE